MVQEQGFILRVLSPSNNKFSVLTRTQGKLVITAWSPAEMRLLTLGSLIQFTTSNPLHNVYKATHIKLLERSYAITMIDLAWGHHLLELCYYFMPLHQPSFDCFAFLVNCNMLCAMNEHFQSSWNSLKRVSIGVLLTMFGFYPSDELLIPIVQFKEALLRFIDFKDIGNIESITEGMHSLYTKHCVLFERWMLECIQTHPRKGAFKTLNFMYEQSLLSLTEG